MASSITVKILGDAREFKKATAEAKSSASGLGSHVAKIGALVGGAFAGAEVLKFGEETVTAAAAEEKAQANLANQIKNNTHARKEDIASANEWIDKQALASGVAKDQLYPALGSLVRVTHSVGAAQKLLGTAMNISAATGKPLAAVSLALGKAYNGNVGGLAKLGVKTKDASGKTLEFHSILKTLNSTFKGASAAAADTASGRMARMKVAFDDVKVKIGEALLPILSKLADFLAGTLIPAIEKVVAWVENHWPQIQATIQTVINRIVAIVTPFVAFFQGVWQRFGATILRFARETWSHIRTVIQGVMQIIRGIIKTVTALIHGDWGQAWNGIKQIFQGVWNVIKGLVRQAITEIKAVLSLAWSAIHDRIRSAWDGIVGFFTGIPGRLLRLVGTFLSAGKALGGAILDGLKSGLTAAAGFAGDVASGIVSFIKGAWNAVAQKVNDFIPDKLGWGPFSINLPDNPIPTLAKGGIVKARPGGTLAILGEAGHDEAVVPLPHGMSRVRSTSPSAPAITIYVAGSVVTERQLVKTVKDEIIKLRLRGVAV